MKKIKEFINKIIYKLTHRCGVGRFVKHVTTYDNKWIEIRYCPKCGKVWGLRW